ncbi:hypothetical protein Tco_0888545 [Tanacetum coccineum]
MWGVGFRIVTGLDGHGESTRSESDRRGVWSFGGKWCWKIYSVLKRRVRFGVLSQMAPQGIGDMSNHKRIYVTPSQTKKVFGNMKREGNGFSGRVTPLFPTMMVQAQEEMGEGSARPKAKGLDKGKGKMVEEEPVKKFLKKYQIRINEELAFKLQAEEEEEERLKREKVEANVALIEEWNDIQAKIKAD